MQRHTFMHIYIYVCNIYTYMYMFVYVAEILGLASQRFSKMRRWDNFYVVCGARLTGLQWRA